MHKVNLFALIFLFYFLSCEKNNNDEGELIHPVTNNGDVVLGILAPDTANEFIRSYDTEIFVGKMIPTNLDNIFFIEGPKDSVLYNLMYCNRQDQTVYYKYDDSAEVYIHHNEDSVKLVSIGNGIYRDLNHGMVIKQLETYRLKIFKKGGRVFMSETTVPGNLSINNLEDTIVIAPKPIGDTISLSVEYSGFPTYFVLRDSRSNSQPFNVYVLSPNLTPWIFFYRSLTDTSHIDYVDVRLEMRAIGNEYGNFHIPCGSFSFSSEFNEFWKQLEKKSLKQRSNIKGDNNVRGVFGSYNATVKSFVAKALWDQASKRK